MIPWTQEPATRSTVPRPRTGETPIRHIRIPDKVWKRIEQIASDEERSKTDVVMEALDRYLAWHQRQQRRASKQTDD